MPTEVTWELVLWLGIYDFASLGQTCSLYNQLLVDDQVWRRLYRDLFHVRQVEAEHNLPGHFWRQLLCAIPKSLP